MKNQEKENVMVEPTRRHNFQYNGSDLYDSFEFKQMTIQLNKAIENSSASSPACQEMNHKLNKTIYGSGASSPELYDSFEFEFKPTTIQPNKAFENSSASSPACQEMKHKLNKTIHGSGTSSPAYAFHLNSPFYRHHLNRIYKESNKTPRMISCPRVEDKQASGRGIREKGFVTRLWLKVKKGLLWKKHESEVRNRPSKAY
ncbi:unnamed protein product [Vicia faba]|uniref:Uncharacterized protein n=1 Tax=Vicia faba TaxID=3906 RepID=A0AAV1AM87_VICFA|nr:unnamed protein product [Vicia faba]